MNSLPQPLCHRSGHRHFLDLMRRARHYFLLTCAKWGIHYNDAFSAMRLDSYRHFLRMRMQGNELTIYPIGLDNIPPRDAWENKEDTITPKAPLEPHLIEKPVIVGKNVPSS